MTDPAAAGFRGAAVRMTSVDLAAEAASSGYALPVLEAVLDVESAGSGFDDRGRPKILTEPHVFYRELGAGPKQATAIRAGLAYLKQGTMPYPPTSDLNYQRLARMCLIDPVAAMRSTSWGIAQVMGFNHAVCGFADVGSMVAAAMEGERGQFGFLLRYVEHAGLAAALRTRNWAAFAAGYNGPGAVQAYAAKLAAAYARHATGPTVRPIAAAPALRQAPVSTSDALNDAEWLRIRAGLAA